MKLIRCPLNGARPLLEFVSGGEVRVMPDPQSCSDAEWTAYLFNRASVPGVKREWWCHTPSGYWFIAERDTARDEILADLRRGRTTGEGRDMMYRLPPVPGEWIDRWCELSFEFEGRSFKGYAGDTIAQRAGRRGRDDAGSQLQVSPATRHSFVREPRRQQPVPGRHAFVRIGAQCARRRHAARRWHAVTAVNTVGGLKRDRARFVEWLAPFLPVGFYYKAFHGQRFPRWERRIRAMSGLGAIAANAPRTRTPKRYAFCDVLVIGAGPSGLAAALSAADAGARVLLVDENARAGGCARWSGASAR